jgi:hypothetical protein
VFIGGNSLTQHGWALNAVTRVWTAAAAISESMSPRPSNEPFDRNQNSR